MLIPFIKKKIYKNWNISNEDPKDLAKHNDCFIIRCPETPLDTPIHIVFTDENRRHEGHEERKCYRVEKQRKGADSNICWSAGVITSERWMRGAKLSQNKIQIGKKSIVFQPGKLTRNRF